MFSEAAQFMPLERRVALYTQQLLQYQWAPREGVAVGTFV